MLPGGAPLARTEAGGPLDAPVLVLGAYPAATHTAVFDVDGVARTLPTAVEPTSFHPGSASGDAVDAHLLAPLGLSRDHVCFTDLWPWFLANTTRASSGRSMADNVAAWEVATGAPTGIERRPSPATLVSRARTSASNAARLRAVFGARAPRLLLTLGTEAAAFVRTQPYERIAGRVDTLFYAAPARWFVLGVPLDVVHLVHPHLLMPHRRTSARHAHWGRRHDAWTAGAGRALIAATVSP
ncbi:MAG: hypothetical protein H6733_09390 [Alphaproteobacteria bacterium]|nr:hypothetical protein [Alphaproteobacteria bacterium]